MENSDVFHECIESIAGDRLCFWETWLTKLPGDFQTDARATSRDQGNLAGEDVVPKRGAFHICVIRRELRLVQGCCGIGTLYPVSMLSQTLRGLMRKDVLLLNGGEGQVHGRRWYQQCMEKAAWRTSIDSVL
jgi:hypothetical protein